MENNVINEDVVLFAELNSALSELRSTIVISDRNNRTDANKAAEKVYSKIFSYLYGYNFICLEHELGNHPAIDICSRELRIAIQVTTVKKPSKIQNTISKFKKYKLNKHFDTLMILYVGSDYAPTIKHKAPFIKDDFVIDLSKLQSKLMLDETKAQNVVDYLRGEFKNKNSVEELIDDNNNLSIVDLANLALITVGRMNSATGALCEKTKNFFEILKKADSNFLKGQSVGFYKILSDDLNECTRSLKKEYAPFKKSLEKLLDSIDIEDVENPIVNFLLPPNFINNEATSIMNTLNERIGDMEDVQKVFNDPFYKDVNFDMARKKFNKILDAYILQLNKFLRYLYNIKQHAYNADNAD